MSSPKRTTPEDLAVARRIKSARLQQGVSQENVAEALGITFQQIQKYETGANRVSAGRIVMIARALDCPVTDLLECGATEIANPASVPMLATKDGVKLARVFNRILSPTLRLMVLRQAELILEIDENVALAKPALQAAE
ncbi:MULTISPECIES: helix-turn-helix domain-containing protein [Rhodopseudomonas]|uniref:helix-turn-helix domain-containing protein n=1 Tax=Rhodopseudomonas TaxID=1073 RepID=UPI0005CAF91C|nr:MULTISPECIES: helix-turn-helix domain-containing protein [Rhodopseudomonas]MDF3809290.1 helix-turn-helix domain-containing protein [Rhodopseudomonas sp. BAL398]WOK19027.1 helix-turn-helix domain-containing protein [Rhodopseudomonas sp. BAL398]